MNILEKRIDVYSRSDEISIYPLGDLHIGSRACAEGKIRKVITEIKNNPNAYWFGGGDILDAIKPMDSKRFDFNTLPDWMIEGKAVTIRERLNDILKQQLVRFYDLIEPIKHKCIGMIEGNHEFAIRKLYNQDIQQDICSFLKCENLTDEFFMRLMFVFRSKSSNKQGRTTNIKLYACHGHGGGRTPGAEPNHLHRLISEWEDADICLRGHSHIYHIIPPKPKLFIPNKGQIPNEFLTQYRHAGNWGCWVYSHHKGPSTYASRACYPARPMITLKIIIKPLKDQYIKSVQYPVPVVELRSITL